MSVMVNLNFLHSVGISSVISNRKSATILIIRHDKLVVVAGEKVVE